ncbi:hypothetical protein DFH06DRAFT_1317747 [Mycena polygramma]|nr:hypothetical protein DFH06DRAFT_1341657 [Mycena polygramma]KAJ7675583.1 hypothetical protein DFH06DRAFT_1317747 [Mycena polygramma]
MAPILRPTGTGNRGATSSVLWLQREDHPGEILVFGTQTGLVVCWRQAADSQMFEEVTVFQMAEPAEITGLAFDPSTNRLAVSHRGCVIQVHELDDKLNPDPVFSVQVQNFLPKALAFIGEPKKRGELLAFGYHDGTILSLNGQTGEVKRARQIGGMVGCAEYNQTGGVFALDDPLQGIALYRTDHEARVRSFPVKRTQPFARPRDVCFADNCASVVSGSDHGCIYVFDRRSAAVTDTLRIGTSDWVQSVTATQINGVSTIIGARSRDWGGVNEIMVWKKKGSQEKGSQDGRRRWVVVVVGLNVFFVGFLLYQQYKAMMYVSRISS